MFLPPRFVQNPIIGIFAPASPFPRDRFEQGLRCLEGLGFSYKLAPHVFAEEEYLAGTDAQRLADLHALLLDPDVHVLMAARGGYGCHRLLPHIDRALLTANPKPIVGFSDLTALHCFIQRCVQRMSIHGPVVTQLNDLDAEDLALFKQVLCGSWQQHVYAATGPVLSPGIATGYLVGGNLSLVTALLGTPYSLPHDELILLIEDVHERPYRIDRMLTQLLLSDVSKHVRGIVIGDFMGQRPEDQNPAAISRVLAERLSSLEIPVLAGFAVGHGAKNQSLVLGAKVELNTHQQTLRYLEDSLSS